MTGLCCCSLTVSKCPQPRGLASHSHPRHFWECLVHPPGFDGCASEDQVSGVCVFVIATATAIDLDLAADLQPMRQILIEQSHS